MSKFTVCVLLYGDHVDLARRCLKSIKPLLGNDQVREFRIGLNDVGDESLESMRSILDIKPGGYGRLATFADIPDKKIKIYSSYPQIFKYPMMRRMIATTPIETEFVMWFDDDSYVTDPEPRKWLTTVDEEIRGVDMIGSIYQIGLLKSQIRWIKDQPWYKRKPVTQAASFITGGWWTIRTSVLQKHNWPLPDLLHNGGDVMLGQLLQQQGHTIKKFRTGVAINADEEGRESRADRRGDTRNRPIGFDYTGPDKK